MMSRDAISALNESCLCFPLSRPALDAAIAAASAAGVGPSGGVGREKEAPPALPPATVQALLAERAHFFAETVVFATQQDVTAMVETAAAVERASALRAYRAAVADRTDLPGHDLRSGVEGTRGVFMGFDFHLTEAGPRLIEINTNAGGAFVVDAMMRALPSASVSTARCGRPAEFFDNSAIKALSQVFFDEWRAAGRVRPLRRIAIVDDAPSEQYLYPDMVLAAQGLREAGVEALIVDARDLDYSKGVLSVNGQPIDLVYNRLTDFDLTEPAHRALRQAWMDSAAVVSPSPIHHALQADKRNGIVLGDSPRLESWGLSPEDRHSLETVPQTTLVTLENADALWAQRRALFFKPVDGFGGKEVYRGAKLTKRVWQRIRSGGFVAQALVPPPRRVLEDEGEARRLKFDVRLFTFAGKPLSLAARLYEGQTTNFRTPGGGFAPVMLFEPA